MSLQAPDWITFRGRHRQLHSHPLEAYLRALPDRPDFRLGGPGQDRGYVASWEVRPDDTLWLTGLTTRPDGDGPDPGTQLVFPQPGSGGRHLGDSVPADPGHRAAAATGRSGTAWLTPRESYLSVWRGRLVMVEEIDGQTMGRVGGELTPHLDDVFGPEEGGVPAGDIRGPGRRGPAAGLRRLAGRAERPAGRCYPDGRAAAARTRRRPDRERSAARDRLHDGLGDWLWVRLLGYRHLTTAAVAAGSVNKPARAYNARMSTPLPMHGRGSATNPPNRFVPLYREAIPGWTEEDDPAPRTALLPGRQPDDPRHERQPGHTVRLSR